MSANLYLQLLYVTQILYLFHVSYKKCILLTYLGITLKSYLVMLILRFEVGCLLYLGYHLEDIFCGVKVLL